MSKLQKLLQELCPDGVEYKPLGDLGFFYGGLTGKKESDFEDGNAKLITYMNVFSNIALNIDIDDRVKIGKNEKQNTVKYGDVLFTGSSETLDECGMSSVLTEKTDEELYLNSFCFGFRLYNNNILLPDFSKYLFRSAMVREQIIRTANGVTRFNISREKMKKVIIPLPPIPVQQEIAQILDSFTKLIKELYEELTVRRKQFEYYRNLLLSFDDDVEWKKLGEICKVESGGTPSRKRHEYWENGKIKWLGSAVCKNQKAVDEVTDYITEQGLKNSSAKLLKPKTTLIALVGATIGKVSYLHFEAAINQNIAGIYPLDDTKLDPSYVFYACQVLYPYFMALGQGRFAMANLTFVKNLKIPVPPLKEQQRIVNILDRFNALINDPTIGIPAEIKARQKQYEYYLNKLLNFKKKR